LPQTPDFDAVVIGSGFGGTIAALTLANYFLAKGGRQRVCLLERGQWWISHELPYRKDLSPPIPPLERIPKQLNMREFLQDTKRPFDFWAHPDNVEGLIDLASKARFVNKAGLYDVRPIADNVAVIAACGVGGGSLVYSNVTVEPPGSVYNPRDEKKKWPTERDGGDGLKKYFEPARIFMGVNKITTIAGLGPKTANSRNQESFRKHPTKFAPKTRRKRQF
jgi:choline dehydrogenase-like flavoprotein